MIMIINILLSIIILFLIFYLYYKYKYQFWSRQPVFHFHNLYYWFFPPGIIQQTVPRQDKYYNAKIQFGTFDELKTEKKALLTCFIRINYLQEREQKYSPTNNAIVPYFTAHNDKSYVSLYMQKVNNSNRIIGSMTTRPLFCKLVDKKIDIYYVDYLCVHKDKRKQGVAQQVIYSHYVNHRKRHKNCIFLFKREGETTSIVPLTIYKTYCFDIKYWKKNIKFDVPNIEITMINGSNIKIILDLLNDIDDNFKCVIKPNIANLKTLCEKKNIYITAVFIDKSPCCLYFFRNTYTTYKNEGCLELTASFLNKKFIDNEKLFTLGALISIDNLIKISPCRYLFIENISNNNYIIKNILEKYTPLSKYSNSYYFYNFAYHPFYSTDVFLLN
jgi:hypothetical protein